MNISVFGLGYVGCVSLGCLARNGHKVIGVDVNPTKVSQINSGKPTIIEKDIDTIIDEQVSKGNIIATVDYIEAIVKSDITIVAVGTPSSQNGHLILDYIFEVANQVGEALIKKDGFHVIAIRSTVKPGTIDKFAEIVEQVSGKQQFEDFDVVVNPEFLREGTAVNDYYNPPLTLIGASEKKSAEILASLYKELPGEIIITDINVAEIMKYVNNTFHALKVGFANEVGNLCKKLEIDSRKVMDIFSKDKQLNISPYYLKPGFAYGGSCLPKDLKALKTLAHDSYTKLPIIESIDNSNDQQITRCVNIITDYNIKKIGFIGLSFKAGTDDLRNSPYVSLVEILLGKGYDLKICDSNVLLSRITGTNKDFIEKHIPHLTKLMVKEIKQLVDESELIVVANKENNLQEILQKAGDKPIIDLTGIDKESEKLKGYYGINW